MVTSVSDGNHPRKFKVPSREPLLTLSLTLDPSEEVIGEIRSVMPIPSPPRLPESAVQSVSGSFPPPEELISLLPLLPRRFSSWPVLVMFIPVLQVRPEPRVTSSRLPSMPLPRPTLTLHPTSGVDPSSRTTLTRLTPSTSHKLPNNNTIEEEIEENST